MVRPCDDEAALPSIDDVLRAYGGDAADTHARPTDRDERGGVVSQAECRR